MKSSVFAAAVVLASVASFVSVGSAAITITHATIFNKYRAPGSSTAIITATLDSAAPGNQFSTYDGNSGLITDIGPTGGEFKVQTKSQFPPVDPNSPGPYPGPEYFDAAGTVDFIVSGGTFSLNCTLEPFRTGGIVKVTNLETGRYFQVTPAGMNPVILSGDLSRTAAPAGSYEFTFDNFAVTRFGFGGSDGVAISLGFVPEPTTLAAVMAGSGLLLHRRRR